MLYRWLSDKEQWTGFVLDSDKPFTIGRAQILRVAGGLHALLVPNDMPNSVNGLPALPLRVLNDKDLVRLEGEILYYSSEVPPRVTRFEDTGSSVLCARCQGPMQTGASAIRCPRCGAWHHEADGLLCWTYDTRCSSCNQRTGDVRQPPPYRRTPATPRTSQ